MGCNFISNSIHNIIFSHFLIKKKTENCESENWVLKLGIENFESKSENSRIQEFPKRIVSSEIESYKDSDLKFKTSRGSKIRILTNCKKVFCNF